MRYKIAILIRVYNRIEDLLCNLQVIQKTWLMHDYEIFIVSNGKADGYKVPDNKIGEKCHLIELSANDGHFSGNAQLLMEGLKVIDLNFFDYLLILEADTWMYQDYIISKYADMLSCKSAVWASARWYDKFYSLATDFALIEARFLSQNHEIFNFSDNPECYVYNYLKRKQAACVFIKENEPSMLPSYIKNYPYAPLGRFYVFPCSRTVTHHIEDYLPRDGFLIKKRHFNIVAGTCFFEEVPKENYSLQRIKMFIVFVCQSIFLRRSWYSRRKLWENYML